MRSRTLLLWPLAATLACGGAESSSQDSIAVERPDIPAQARSLDSGQVAIEYLAHAAFRIHSPEGTTVLIDPYASRVWLGYDFPEDLSADVILITHPHYDHDAGEFRGRPFPWGREVPVFRDPGTYKLGDVSIEGIAGKHADPYGKEFGQINTLFVIEIAGLRIAHLGDNGPLTDENIEALGHVDVLMMPADGEYHILKEDETQSIRDTLEPRILVPMHYRIPALETDPESPETLGEIDPWLAKESNVRRADGNVVVLGAGELPEEPEVLVFRHSPLVER